MLNILRKKKVMKPLLKTFVVIISMVFVLWGAGTLVERRRWAGEIYGKKVFVNEYVRAWEAEKNTALITYGPENFNRISELLDLPAKAWDRLIMLEEAKRQKIKVVLANQKIRQESVVWQVFQNSELTKNQHGHQTLHGFLRRLRQFSAIKK